MKEDAASGTACPRIHWLKFRGQEILQVDFSQCTASQVREIARNVPTYVMERPRGSVLVLTDFANASFDDDALQQMRHTAVLDKPFVKKSALIGATSLPRGFYENVQSHSGRVMTIFESREEALEWLIAD